jgi:glycosyltransferase involved in cell wall biosynthesis
MLEGYRHHVYDFLGVARVQGALPPRLRARYLLYLYGIECWRPLRRTRRGALDGAAVRLACSRYTVERLRLHNPSAPAVTPLHLALANGSSSGPSGALRNDRDGSPEIDAAMLAHLGRGFVLVVGRLAPGERYKGHDDLLAALTFLAGQYPDLSLVIVGEGEDRPRLESRARELGVATRVRFTGYVGTATLEELYRRCAVFAMPSSGEGFGFVYLEAMRAAKPCIALAGSAAAEIVVDGMTGRLVAPGAKPLAAALAEVLADPDRAAALGAAGRDRLQREFAPDVFAARLAEQLDELVAEA